MAQFHAPGTTLEPASGSTTAPMVVLFERDDAIAVPLLSQLRMASYDVRAARTPVELFGMLGKQLVALVLVDLGNAAAGRREFWVALDAQRRGRAMQVMTFRFTTPTTLLDPDFEPAARALADVEVQGAHEFQKIIDGVRQRVPLNGGMPGAGMVISPQGAVPPIGAALGMPSPFEAQRLGQPVPGAQMYGQPQAMPQAADVLQQAPVGSQPYMQQFNPQASPFASPATANPFAANEQASPFAQPYAANPFADGNAPAHRPINPPSPAFGNSDQYAAAYGAPHIGQPAAFSQPVPGFGGQPYDARNSNPTPGEFQARGNSQQANGRAHVEDAWIPPETDGAQETGIVPSMAYQEATVPTNFPNGAPNIGAARLHDEPRQELQSYQYQYPTGPVPSARAGVTAATSMPSLPSSPAEQALGTVLVEGALLTPQKLEALKGIQQMLAGVHMQFQIGELALLFKFLSPDQLLAALLVSRGLVSPQQIAALGRVKQELSVSGMDHDLATLLQMFHVLPPEEVHALRAELSL